MLVIMVTAYLAQAAATRAAEESKLPNIVFILVDDMGYGDLQCFNPESKIKTPAMDSVAVAGMRFTDAHASGPLCHMSRYGLMTGRYPFRTNVGLWPKQPLIEPGQTTLASLLSSQGYKTAMVGKWHLGFSENGYDKPLPGGPVDVGFDSFFGIRASTDIPPYFYIRDAAAVAPPTLEIEAKSSEGWSPIQGEFSRAGLIAPGMQLSDVLPRFTDEAITVIENHDAQAEPLFLYLAYPAPHTPWLPSPEYAGKSQAGMYGDFTEMVDGMIAKVLSKLDETGLAKDTLLIISSDNGPVWYQEDVERFEHDASGGLRGMKADAWEAGHRMPLIVRWPGVVAQGTTSPQLVSFVDMLATFAEITEYPLQADDGPDSFSFVPALLGRDAQSPVRDTLVLKSGKGLLTIRENEWKLIDGVGSGGFSDGRGKTRQNPAGSGQQLYNLQADLAESKNLVAEETDVAARLNAKLKQIVAAQGQR